MQTFQKTSLLAALVASALLLESCDVLRTPTPVIHDGDVTEAKIADEAVGTRALASTAVTTKKIAPGAVTASKLDSSMTLSVAKGVFASDLTVGGNLGVTGTFAVNTDKFTVASTGDTVAAGTLGVTGATTLSSTLAVSSSSTFNGASTWTTTTTQPISASRTDTTAYATTAGKIAIGATMNSAASAPTTESYYGVFGDTVASTATTHAAVTGILGRARTGLSNAIATTAIGVDSELKFSATANSEQIANGYGFHTKVTNSSGNTLSKYIGLYIENPTGAGNSALAGSQYGVVADGAATKNFFAGPVGLGVTNPTNALDVSGAVSITGATTIAGATGITGATTVTGALSVSTAVTFSGLGTDNAQQAVCINSTTGLLSKTSGAPCTTPSDRRLKENIQPIENALDRLINLSGVSFFWKDKKKFDDRRNLGLIAQDIKSVFPELVVESNKGFLSVNYQGMIGPIVQAIKEFHAKWLSDHQSLEQQKVLLGQLEKKIELENLALKAENKHLKERLDKIEETLARASVPKSVQKGKKVAKK